MNNFIWTYKKHNHSEIDSIINTFDVPKSIATIMSLKNINSKDKSREFFYEDMEQLHDPFLMQDMEKAVSHLLTVRDKKELILIVGDYDTDGTTAAAILFLYFKSIELDAEYYIPDRQKEGYGVSKGAIDFAKSIGATCIITCDCGIKAFEAVKYAKSLKIDTIITDHHKQEKILPEALAILNQNRHDCDYPFKGLCGAGVAFKLCCAVNQELYGNIIEVMQYTDLVAIATTADVMPIIDENRFIVKRGLKLITEGRNHGISSLLTVSRLDPNDITVGKLSFWFIPKINAAGRLGDARRSVKLLTTKNHALSFEIAEDLEKENEKRKELTFLNEQEAKRMISSILDINSKKIIILYNSNWHFGIVGIVASRIKEIYNRPTIILSENDGVYKGSCRSIKGYDIVDALSSCSDILSNFGGHPMAAGLSISKDHILEFCERMENNAMQNIDFDLTPKIYIDYELKLSDIDSRFIKFLKYLEPFGPGNIKPLFSTKNLEVVGHPRLLGKDKNTIKFQVKGNTENYEVIGFNMVTALEKTISQREIDIVYSIEINKWQGKATKQLVLKDVRYSDE